MTDSTSWAAIAGRKLREKLAKEKREKDLAVWLYNLEREVHA